MLAVNGVLGSRPGSSHWDPNADLNRNGTVTTSDRIIVYQNTGHAITAPAGANARVTPAVAASLPAWLLGGSTQLTVANDLPAGSPVNGITFSVDTGALVLNGNAVELSGAITNQSPNTQTINLPLTLVGGNCTVDTAAGEVTIAGSIGQSGGGWGITKTGTGTLVLSGANTYTGGTRVLAGVLQVAGADALPESGILTIGGGGVFVFDPSAMARAALSVASETVGGANEPGTVRSTVVERRPTAGMAAPGGAAGPTDITAERDEYVAGELGLRQVANLSYSAATHDAVLKSPNTPTAAVGPVAAGWWDLDNRWSHGPGDRKHDTRDSAVDAVMAMLERIST